MEENQCCCSHKKKERSEKEYKDLIKGMYNYDEILKNIADNLNKIAQTFQEADEEIKRNLIK